LTKTYITATSLRSASGATQDSIYDVFNKKSALCVYDDIIHEKKICIGKFKEDFTFNELLIQSVQEVLDASNLKDFSDTLLLVGSSVGGMATTEKILFKENNYEKINPQKHSINVIASTLDNQFNFLANRSYSTACTSSANALKTAKDLISLKAYENILIIGADEICSTTIFGFSSLGILSDEICTPFKQGRKGMNVAEGIGVLLLQNKPNKNSIELCGAGASSDAYHIANPDPTSTGAISAIKKALIDANIDASKINYINAHGTGTQANDESEANAIIDIFGTDVAVSSSKSNLGHTLGAAGAIEAIICAEALKRQILPPQLDSTQKEKEINLVEEPKESKINYALSNSFAFGGNNVSLVFGVYNEN
jgi:3-oxoacyl-[acyl-carrier-protein] synthase-1